MKKFTGYQKGVNLGGWISQCGEDNYNDAHYRSFITKEDIENIASWGIDHIRLPIDFNVIQNEDGSFIESGFEYIDDCICQCEKNNLNIILDLHKAFGYVFDDKNYCDFFYKEEYQDIFVKLWQEFARRYGHLHSHVAFELLNEITDSKTAKKWNEIADRTIRAIREISPNIKIIIGGIHNNSIAGLELLEKPYDENIVFTFHCYSPMIFTHQRAYWVENMPSNYSIEYPGKVSDFLNETIKVFGNDHDNELIDSKNSYLDSNFFEQLFVKAVLISEKYNVPLYCGEYGVIDIASEQSTLKWFSDIHTAFEKYNIARAVWTYKGKDFGITDKHYQNISDDLIKLL